MIKVSYHLRGSVLGCPAWWHAPSVVIFAMLSAVAGAAASPVNVPPSATPGGVQPRLEEELSVRPAPAPNFPIPSVLHQPAPATSGSTIQVTGFVLRNLREWPEHGITEAALAQLLEQLRAAQPQGFRIDQLQAVANAVTKFYREAGFILAQVYIPVQNVEHGIVQLEVQEGRLGEVSFIGNQCCHCRSYCDERM